MRVLGIASHFLFQTMSWLRIASLDKARIKIDSQENHGTDKTLLVIVLWHHRKMKEMTFLLDSNCEKSDSEPTIHITRSSVEYEKTKSTDTQKYEKKP